MKAYWRVLCGAMLGLTLVNMQAPRAVAADAYPVFTDVNVGPQAFGASAGSFGGLYTLNSMATFNGNPVLSINQNGNLACCHGALIEVSVSNGENGVNSTDNGANVDIPNSVPANSVFAAIGNASGRLENGNVIRFSAWYRSDPSNPITLDPQVQPVMKIEYWKEALSGFADTNATQAAPGFGDRVFDQDQQGVALGIPDLPHWVEMNGDGVVNDPTATVANGRITQTVTTEWRRAEVTHAVNSLDWLGIGAEAFAADNVAMIETVKAVMFMGDFAFTNLTGDGADGGNLLVDNVLVEVFKNAAAVMPNLNPNPTLSEGLPGDYNGNGTVDAADYVVWRNGGPLQNDPTPGVSAADYDFWRSRFGTTAGSGSGLGAAAVPEPATWLLVICGLAMTIAGRRAARRSAED